MEQITGRLTADATVNTVSNGKQVVNFSVAVNKRYKTKEGEKVESVRFFKCDYWNRPGIAAYLKKGALIELAGIIDFQVWKDKGDGNPKGTLVMHVTNITFLGSSKAHETVVKNNTAQTPVQATDDLPF